MSYDLKVIKDHPIGFWPLDESSGDVAFDKSGCGNNGLYVLSPERDMLSLVPGGVYGTKITNTSYITFSINKDYYGASVGNGFGTSNTSDNDFTLEAWIYSDITSSSETPIFADDDNNIGLFWHNGDIVFKISNDDVIRYAVSFSKKAIHIVGTYSVNRMSLFIDAVQVSSKSLNKFKFSNQSLNLAIGPTTQLSDSFIIDAPAVYRYSLITDSIRKHFIEGNTSVSAINVVYPDGGTLFSCTDAKLRAAFDYSYPVNKRWVDFVNEDTYYDDIGKFISFNKTENLASKTFVINDFFIIPDQIGLITSKIEWRNDLGISVESSVDGSNWLPCINGQPLPQYNLDSFDTSSKVYIKITMSTSDASKFLPRLSFFCITFYSNRTLYADNYGDTITSSSDYYLGALNYPILSRNYMNGIRPKTGTGFNLNTNSNVKTIELFFTPISLTEATTIFSHSGVGSSRIDWTSSGLISSQNVSSIYINGIDVTSETNINNILTVNQPHHIVAILNNSISGTISFNFEASGIPSHLYKNIAIYEVELSQQQVETHFELYTGKPVDSVLEPLISLTEKPVKYYNNDWIVIKSI